TMLALIEGWVDVVTEDATERLAGSLAISEMVRRRRALGGPSEQTFVSLIGLELRPRRLREATNLWRRVTDLGGIEVRDGLWEHPDMVPTTEELDDPELLLTRLGLVEGPGADEFDEELGK